MGGVDINLFIIKLTKYFILFIIILINYNNLFFNIVNTRLYIPGKRRNNRNARVAAAVVDLAADGLRRIVRCTNEDDLTQGAVPQLCVWDVRLAEEANATAVDAITHQVDGERRLLFHPAPPLLFHPAPPLLFHPALPQKVVLNKDLLLPDADDDVIREDRRAAAIRMLLAGAPAITFVCPHDI